MLSKTSWMKLVVWIFAFEAIGFCLGLITKAHIHPWYESLNQSSLTPPGVVFSIVWSFLYALLAFVGWILSHHKNKPPFKLIYRLFCIQMFMNWAWTLLFFQWHWLGVSFFWLLMLTLLNLIIIVKVKSQHRLVALLLVPYCAWLFFAAYLNMTIWFMN